MLACWCFHRLRCCTALLLLLSILMPPGAAPAADRRCRCAASSSSFAPTTCSSRRRRGYWYRTQAAANTVATGRAIEKLYYKPLPYDSPNAGGGLSSTPARALSSILRALAAAGAPLRHLNLQGGWDWAFFACDADLRAAAAKLDLLSVCWNGTRRHRPRGFRGGAQAQGPRGEGFGV